MAGYNLIVAHAAMSDPSEIWPGAGLGMKTAKGIGWPARERGPHTSGWAY